MEIRSRKSCITLLSSCLHILTKGMVVSYFFHAPGSSHEPARCGCQINRPIFLTQYFQLVIIRFHAASSQWIRKDADSKSRDPLNPSILLNVTLTKPYFKELKPALNELGLPERPYYITQDVCKVLKILPDAFRQRIYREHYPEFEKIGVKRIFTLDQIKDLIRITKHLIRKGTLSS